MSLKNSILAPVQQTEFLGLEILRNETICSSKKGRGDCLEVAKCNGRQFDIKGFHEAEPAIQRCSYKNVLCSKFTEEHPRRSMKLHCNFIDITLDKGVLLWICCMFSEHFFLWTPLDGWFWQRFRSLQQIKLQALRKTWPTNTWLLWSSRQKSSCHGGLSTWKFAKENLSPQDLTIFLDGSKKGWGASCQVITTGFRWSSVEKAWHINALELEGSQLFHLQNSKI